VLQQQAERFMTPPDLSRAGRTSGLIDATADWLMTQALGDTSMERLVEGCCARLWSAGVPLQRVLIGYRTLHPLFTGVAHIWRRDAPLVTERHDQRQAGAAAAFDQGPHGWMLRSGVSYLRRRLTGPDALLDFPVLRDLRDEGATDYLGFIGPFVEEGVDGILGSWTTDRESGFSDEDVGTLLRIQRRLAVACKVTIKDQIAHNVLATYLGAQASAEVLSGKISRGDGRTLRTVLWYSDLRNSTRLSETMPVEEFFTLLNRYFECSAGAVLAEGGQVVLFIGDAVLGIFPVDTVSSSAEQGACAAAMAAARRAARDMGRFNEERAGAGFDPLAFGLGLHVGDVKYGNLGVPDRLQFDVIGPAVNEVVRLEGLAKTLARQVLVSGTFARCLPLRWEALGRHELRGLGAPREVFAPPREHLQKMREVAAAEPGAAG
jgi:adenylate cyclase